MRISFETISNACFSNSKTASRTNYIDHLKPGSIAMVMDFSEIYGCLFQSEVQSGFFDRNQVTIHPMMIYYKIKCFQ
jgi:hypothetical protein